jgi:quinol monooxygenase YgiN
MIRLTGRLICANAAEAALVQAHLPEHIARTRAEPGCLSFTVEPAADLVWTVAEDFVDRAAFAAHQARVQASDWGRATREIRRDYAITETP